MRRALLAVLLVTGAACGRGTAPPPGSEILDQSRSLADRMCACPDKACGTPLRTAWDALTKQIGGVSFTPEQVDTLAREDQRFFGCMGKLDH